MLKLIGFLAASLVTGSIQTPPQNREGHIAEEDIDASSLDSKTTSKKAKKSPLDDIEFVSEADKPLS